MKLLWQTSVPTLLPFAWRAPRRVRLRRSIPDALIIGADQVAVLEGIQLGKPLNRINATRQLRTHSRKRSRVLYRSESLQWPQRAVFRHDLSASRVKFRKLTDQQIENYLR